MGCARNIPKFRIIGSVLLLIASSILSGCVTSTLESAKSDPAISDTNTGTIQSASGDPTAFEKKPASEIGELALTGTDGSTITSREQAIADIHRKASAAPQNTAAPDLGNPRTGAAEIRSNDVVNANINELNARQQASKAQLPDEELLANQRSMAELRKKAASHYDSALKNIEKSE